MAYIVIINGDHTIGATLTAMCYDTQGNQVPFNKITWFGQDNINSDLEEITRYSNQSTIQILNPVQDYIIAEIQINESESQRSQRFVINKNDIVTTSIQNALPTIGNGISVDTPVSMQTGLSSEITNISRINQSLKLILNTAKGEFPMLPNFGCNLHRVLFQTIQNESDLESIRLDLMEDLSKQEPRINIKNIQIGFDYIDTLLIIVEYAIYNTNIQSNLIYDYKMGGELNV